MSAIQDIDEVLRAHASLLPGGRGAPIIANGQRVGNSLLRAATTLISAALQTEVEETFKATIPLTFEHFDLLELERYWDDSKRAWGNPNSNNVRKLFFRLGFSDVLDGLSWQKCTNTEVVRLLDEINQVRNRVAHGHSITVNGNAFRLTKPTVHRWRNFTDIFLNRFRPFVLGQFDQAND